MGKAEEEPPVSSPPPDENAGPRCTQCGPIGKIVGLRCVAALVFGAAVMLSAVFWLPPFVNGDRARHPGEQYGADIVASFRLQKTVFQQNANIPQLQYDIFDEIGVPNSLVMVMSLEPLTVLNMTNVVFGIWPYPKNSTISATGLSILKSSFVSLFGQQSTLHLSTSLFGNSSFFQVLKFPGGITIIPPQNAFLLQKVNVLFNFTLNFSIYQVQSKVGELKEQMKSGLLLSSYENLYVSLTNLNGSTIAAPTIVQTFIVLAVGNRQPSAPRLKQLAQTIANSSEGNLGLNHTVFGRVKQIRLSSYLQRSLNRGSSKTPISPSPAPQPHHHYHHHRHQNPNIYIAPAPAPRHSFQGAGRSGCPTVVRTKPKSVVSSAAPVPSPHHSSASHLIKSPPSAAPHMRPASPLPAVIFAHVRPPSDSVTDIKTPDGAPFISPSQPSSSLAGGPALSLILFPLLYVLMHL